MKRSFKVYAVSTASEKHFPDNSLVKFSHYLPSQIALNKQWQVAVAGVGLHLNINTFQAEEGQAAIYLVGSFKIALQKTLSAGEWGPKSFLVTKRRI